jgi:preprotein translocase subunit SecD
MPRWKIWSITLTCVLGILLAVPSLLPAHVTENWPGWARQDINLGLDLAGGSELLLEAETGSLVRQRLEAMEDAIRADFRTNNIDIAELSSANNQVTVTVRNPAQRDLALQRARTQNQAGSSSGQVVWEVAPAEANKVVLVPTEAGNQEAIQNAMEVARDVIDRRINSLGTLEPTIIRQGASRILVQVPGLQDPEAVKTLIGRTARLEFKLLAEGVTQEQLAARRAPAGVQILPSREGGMVAVQRRAMVTGEQIVQAQQSFDENQQPDVTIRFDTTGGTRFAKITRENVGKPFAIILDNEVLSAPVIREAIMGGQASISGGFTVEEANQLAISLRSGRLPVELKVVQERTVGPELGYESIRLGIIASIVAIAAVVAFMLITYGRFGFYAVVGLAINALMILGIMALFNGTLTLPGIAGFVLTIGAAVDANVLINERIREEQRRGRRLHDALESGYREASTAIFDANITNTIAAALMWYFGSGPIRGFAVVLMIGIVTSVFTAVNVTRMFVALWVRRKRPKELHI